MQYRLTLWRDDRNPSEGPLWEEVISTAFPRFEQGDLVTEIQSMAKNPDETFVVSRVEYGFQGIGPSREVTQNVYIKVHVGGLSN